MRLKTNELGAAKGTERGRTMPEPTGQELWRAIRDERDAAYEKLCHITADNEWITSDGEIAVAELYRLNTTLARVAMRSRDMRLAKPVRCLDLRADGVRTCSFKTGAKCKGKECSEYRPA